MLNQIDFVPNLSRFNKKYINLDKCRTKTIQFQSETAFLKATLHSKDMLFLKAALQICTAKKLSHSRILEINPRVFRYISNYSLIKLNPPFAVKKVIMLHF